MSQAIQQIIAELGALDAHTTKVQGELIRPTRSFTITALNGVFADDTQVKVGDVCHVNVVRGRVGQLNTNGIWNDIANGTIVEYWVTSGGVDSNRCVEAFYG